MFDLSTHISSTARTPPLCDDDSPRSSNEDISYESHVIKLSAQKLESATHKARLRHSTLIRSVHRRALQHALSSSLSWLSDVRGADELSAEEMDFAGHPGAQDDVDPVGGRQSKSMWDMVDDWENDSRKRGDMFLDDQVRTSAFQVFGLLGFACFWLGLARFDPYCRLSPLL